VPDEVVYGLLGRSLYSSGRLQILGAPTPFFSLVYPALVGPFLSIRDYELGYGVLKAFQALLMSLTAVPVYLWGRSFCSPRNALLAAALTLAVPGLAYSGFVMTEVVFYPVLCLAAWAMARALDRPTLGRQALLVGAIGLALATRVQAIVLVPALFLAVGLVVAFDRTWLRGARRYAPALGTLVAFGAAAVAVKVARGGSVQGSLLGAYRVTGNVSYGLGDALRFALYHAADVLILTAVFPVLALAILAARAFAGEEPSAAARAYVAVAISLTLGLVVEVGIFASRLLGRLAERNLLGLAPVLFLALALWLERGAPRPRVAGAIASIAALALLATLPAGKLATRAAQPDAFALIPLVRLHVHAPSLDLRLVVALGGAALVALFAFVPRRLVRVVPAVAIVLLAASSVSASRVVAAEATLFRPAMVGSDERWIDDAANGPVAYLYAGERAWSGGGPVWVNLFWNSRIRRVFDLFGTRALGPLPQTAVRTDPDGRLVAYNGRPAVARWLVASSRDTVAGTRVAANPSAGLALWRVSSPVRLVSREYGIRRDTGIVTGTAQVIGYGCRAAHLQLSIGAPEDRVVEVRVDGHVAKLIPLRKRVPWRGTVPVRSIGSWCTVVVQGQGGGFYFDRFRFVPGP
jgi:hypothetical protein